VSTRPERIREALERIQGTDPDLLRQPPPRWTMPRDMSGFSNLEADLLAAIHSAGLPQPEWEYLFAPGCCEHPKAKHRRGCGCEPAHEHVPGRRWRFDFAWPAYMVAAECEGGTWSGGRHTTGTGFEKDAEKYNAATVLGWRVVRFTQRQITSGEALLTLERMLG
jgi:hypothetical protein